MTLKRETAAAELLFAAQCIPAENRMKWTYSITGVFTYCVQKEVSGVSLNYCVQTVKYVVLCADKESVVELCAELYKEFCQCTVC